MRRWRRDFITAPYEHETMRICYIAPTGVHTKRWLKYFADAGHDVHLVTSGTAPNWDMDNVDLHALRRFGPKTRAINYLINTLPLMLQFKRLIKNISPDIIHAHYIMETTLLGAASGFHPFVVTAWGSDVLIAPQESRISRLIARYVLKRADLITCDTEHMQPSMIKLGADHDKINIIKFAVDTREFKPGQKNEMLMGELGILNSPVIISLRHLELLYDIETLLVSAHLVLKKVPEAKFVILGKGSLETKLKELSQSLGVSDSVRFVGLVPADKVPQYLMSADICVSTALSDAGPGGIIEAMACELPVITTDFGDNRKWVEDGVNGYIIPLKNPRVLASRIVHLIRNPDIRQKFGQINRRIIVERNTWETEMGKMEKLYEELITRCKP